MNIITRFIIATEEGIDIIMKLARDLAVEKFSSILDQNLLEKYIDKHFNKEQLVSEINDFSNQWLVVYVDEKPVGYAKITSRGNKPEILENKRAIRIADLAILYNFPQMEIKKSLFQKSLEICRYYDAVWINEYNANPMISHFENEGFLKQEETYQLDELGIPSICLIRLNM